jgi:hypothetical protein
MGRSGNGSEPARCVLNLELERATDPQTLNSDRYSVRAAMSIASSSPGSTARGGVHSGGGAICSPPMGTARGGGGAGEVEGAVSGAKRRLEGSLGEGGGGGGSGGGGGGGGGADELLEFISRLEGRL